MIDRDACSADGFCDASGSRNVVFLNQDTVRQAETVVSAATHSYRVLFERSQTRGRLSRVEYRRSRVRYGFDELTGQSCNARKTLQKIQSHTFTRKQSRCGSLDGSKNGAFGDRGTLAP